MSPARIVTIFAFSVFVSAPSLAAANDLPESESAPSEIAVETDAAMAASGYEKEAAAEEEKAEEPKIVCRYVKTSTSRLGKKVCSPAEE